MRKVIHQSTNMYVINYKNSRPNLNSSFISIVVAYNMHIGLGKLDYTYFLKLFNGLYNACIVGFFQKGW